MLTRVSALSVLLLSYAIAACGDAAREEPGADAGLGDTSAMAADTALMPGTNPNAVTATVRDTAGRDLGTLTLATAAGAITVTGTLTGLAPGEHAIHLHTTGSCEPPRFESAGDHWNPTNAEHGAQSPGGQHLGDLPNLTVGSDSVATVQVSTVGGSLRDENALLDSDGAAVIVHANADDYRTQPSGNAGDPIACGVVEGQAG